MKFALLFGAASCLIAADPGDWIGRLGGKASRDARGQIAAVDLRGSWINDAEMVELARLPHLVRLDLSHTRIGDEGMLALKSAPKVQELNLFYSEWLTDQGLTAIRDWKHLKRLNLRGTRISDGTLALLSKLTGLEALDIANTQVTDNGLDYLITLTNLKELAIGRSRLGDNALEVLRMLPTLTYLDLSGARSAPPDMGRRRGGATAMPESMVRALAELKDLRTLRLGNSTISAEGVKILSSLEKIEKVGLEGCAGVDDRAVAELANWKSLKYVDLQDTRVTQKGLDGLKAAKPDLVILANPPAPPKT